MKIIYIANTLMPTDRAHGFQIAKTCEKFSSFGNEVKLLVPNRKNTVKTNTQDDDLFDYYGVKRNFDVEKISFPDVIFLTNYVGAIAFYLQTLLFSFKLIFKKVGNGAIIFSRDILPLLIFKWRGFSVIYNAHNWSQRRAGFLKMFFGYKLKIVCNSEGTLSQVVKDGFLNSIFATNGVDLEEFDNLGDKFEIRKRLKLPTDKKIVMYAGHLYGWKGADVLIRLTQLFLDRKELVFVVVGGDETEVKVYEEKIKSGKFLNLLLLGQKPKQEIPSYLKSADILLLPNTSGTKESVLYTSPIKMFEYMASGTPIIASDLPSLRSVLDDGNSFLVSPDSEQSIARGIDAVLENSGLAEKVALRAKEDVKKYTWDEYAKKVLNFIAP